MAGQRVAVPRAAREPPSESFWKSGTCCSRGQFDRSDVILAARRENQTDFIMTLMSVEPERQWRRRSRVFVIRFRESFATVHAGAGHTRTIPFQAVSSSALYDASLRALRYIETRSPTRRRFGADADALWRTFQGHLTAADRVELLLRDADAEYPGAFGARTAFDLRGMSEDDPFGTRWPRPSAAEADALWRKVNADAPPRDVASALTACAAAWDITIAPLDIAPITPTTRLLVVGPSAIASLAVKFSGASELAWADQVTCVATPTGHRHLAALVAALLGSPKPTRIVTATGVDSKAAFDRVVASPDADPDDRAAAASVAL
jgi:hypothetical protein